MKVEFEKYEARQLETLNNWCDFEIVKRYVVRPESEITVAFVVDSGTSLAEVGAVIANEVS